MLHRRHYPGWMVGFSIATIRKSFRHSKQVSHLYTCHHVPCILTYLSDFKNTTVLLYHPCLLPIPKYLQH